MNKVLIFTSFVYNIAKTQIKADEFDCVICADGGLTVAKTLGITPDILIGDFDSTKLPQCDNIIRLPMEKNMTDTEAAIDLAISKGYADITILGGLGGRFDHTMGNIGMLAKHLDRDKKVCIVDGSNKVFMLLPGTYDIEKSSYKYLGLVSYGKECENLSISGVKYPLEDYRLPNDTTLGVSNEILENTARLSFTSGKLLLIQSND